MMPFPTPNMDVASLLNPTANPTSSMPKKSSNKPYEMEHLHFIQYCKDDLKLPWPNIEIRFNEIFPNSGCDPKKEKSGLQCRYYRAQIYPVLDIRGNPVLNDDGMVIMWKMPVRKRGQKAGLIVPVLDGNQRPVFNESGCMMMRELGDDEFRGPIGRNLQAIYQQYYKLIDRVPKHVAEYGWVSNEHKALARRKAKHNQDYGVELPAAVLSGGVEVEVVVWAEELAHRNARGKLPKNPRKASCLGRRAIQKLSVRPKL